MITTVTLNASVDKLYLVNHVQLDTVMRVQEVSNTAGGKGLNVAKVAALAGEKVRAIGFLGGYNGQYVRALLRERGIEDDFTEIAGETRSCINVRDVETGKHTEFLEPGSEIAPENLDAFLLRFDTALRDSNVVTVSGSAPKGTPVTFYGDLVRRAKSANVPLLLDTSGAMLEEGLKNGPTLMKPNSDEIAQLLGKEACTRAEVLAAARNLYEEGIPYVVVSLGGEGSVLICSEGAYQARPPKIEAINTVGCGDSMVAGLAIGFARKLPPQEMLRFATAVSAANALSMLTGHYEQKDFDEIFPSVEIVKI